MYILSPINNLRPYKVKKLDQGGFGCVYEVADRGHEVAVKVARRELGDDGRYLLDMESWDLSQVRHPNVVGMVKVDKVIVNGEEVPCVVEELLDGILMTEFFEEGGRLQPRRALEQTRKILEATEVFHQQGLYNLDLKPGNIMFVLGEPILFDFASVVDRETKLVFICGTNNYWPPEALIYTILQGNLVGKALPTVKEELESLQIRDNIKEYYLPNPSWDLYAAGIILFELVTGESAVRSTGRGAPPPNTCAMFIKDIISHLALPQAIAVRNIPSAIATIILRATTFKPGEENYGLSQRYQNCGEMIADIDHALAML